MCKLNYAGEFTLNPDNTGAAVVHDFRANSLYDPDQTGVGHQPMGFDQLCLMFNHFTVVKSYIKVTCLCDQTLNQPPSAWGIALTGTNNEIVGSTLTDILEDDHGKFRQGGIVFSAASKWASQQKSKFDLKKFFNKTTWDDDTFRCTAAANPAEVAFFEVWATSVNGTEPVVTPFIAKIQYVVLCSEPKMLDPS